LVGSGAGAGIGLMIVLAGSLIGVAGLMAYALPVIRGMEAHIPDWETETLHTADATEGAGSQVIVA
jgi:hypothetical protein